MKCKLCNQDLLISGNKMESPVGSTEITSILTMVCRNPDCKMFCGNDMSNPLKIAETIKRKI